MNKTERDRELRHETIIELTLELRHKVFDYLEKYRLEKEHVKDCLNELLELVEELEAEYD